MYKDDFNSERADRVRTQEAKDDIQSQLTQVTADAATYQSQVCVTVSHKILPIIYHFKFPYSL